MSRISPVDPTAAEGKAKTLLDGVRQALGVTPNLFKVAAQSPAALDGLVSLNRALAGGKLGAKLREQIALSVAEINACDYCLSAHTVLGSVAGLKEGEIASAREGRGSDARSAAVLHFAAALVRQRGQVSDAEIAHLRNAGLSDAEIVETVANVALNVFTNYLNHAAATDIDFPVVQARSRAAA